MPLHPDFTRTYLNQIDTSSRVVWLPFSEKGLLCRSTECDISLLRYLIQDSLELSPGNADDLLLRSLNGLWYIARETDNQLQIPDTESFDLRSLYGKIPLQEWLIAGYAAQILHWRKTSAYCPVCGSKMGPMGHEWARMCTKCSHERYPQVSPALLILVHDGNNRILMAHKPGWGDRYSIFAGFVLPGESLEECVHREVAEEAGVIVDDLEYSGSQPWPFPHQLMIGFKAKYLSGEIKIDNEELDDARWFTPEEMPALPGQLSLSRQMIENWLAERKAQGKV